MTSILVTYMEVERYACTSLYVFSFHFHVDNSIVYKSFCFINRNDCFRTYDLINNLGHKPTLGHFDYLLPSGDRLKKNIEMNILKVNIILTILH